MSAFSAIIYWAVVVVSAVYQQQAAARQRKRAKKAQEEANARADAAKGLKVPTEGEAASLHVIYGRQLIGGVRVAHDSSSSFSLSSISAEAQPFINGLTSTQTGSKHEFLYIQQALCFAGIHRCIHIDVDGADYSDAAYATVGGEGHTDGYPEGVGALGIWVYPKGNEVCAIAAANMEGRTGARFTNTAFATGAFRLNRDNPQFGSVPVCQFYVEGQEVHGIEGVPGSRHLTAGKYYTNNPALCLLDYLMSPVYGRGLSVDQLDLESFYEGFRICEEIVAAGMAKDGKLWSHNSSDRFAKLYEANISLDSSKSIRDNVESLLDCMGGGELSWSSGMYRLQLLYPKIYNPNHSYKTGDVAQVDTIDDICLYRAVQDNPGLPTVSGWVEDVATVITDDDLIRGDDISIAWPNASSRFNYVTVRFNNEALDFAEDTVAWPPKDNFIDGTNVDKGDWTSDGSYSRGDIVAYGGSRYQLTFGYARVMAVAPASDNAWMQIVENAVYRRFFNEDGGVPLEGDFFEQGVVTYVHALARAEQRVRTSRASTAYKLKLRLAFAGLEPGDALKLSSEVFGISAELLRVEDVEVTKEGIVQVNAYKLDARTYAWNVADNEVLPVHTAYNLTLGQAMSLVFSPDALRSLSIGRLTWMPSNDVRVTSYRVKYTTTIIPEIDGSTEWHDLGLAGSAAFEIPMLPSGDYVFTVVAMSRGGSTAPRNGWPLVSSSLTTRSFASNVLVPLQIYKRSSTPAMKPVGGRFDFSARVLTSTPSGWSRTVPEGTAHLYSSTAIAASQTGTGIDEDLLWESPAIFQEALLTMQALSQEIGVLQSEHGVNYGYGSSKSELIVLQGEADVTSTVLFTVASTNGCTAEIDGTSVKVVELAQDTAYVTVCGAIGFRKVYLTLTVRAINVGYTVDLTPPPDVDLDTVTLSAMFSSLQISLSAKPPYAVGHGHDHTEVWVSDTNDLTTATLLTTFDGTRCTVAYKLATVLHTWLAYCSKDAVSGNRSYSGAITFGKVGQSDLGSQIVTADNLAASSVGGTQLQANCIVAGSAAIADGAIRNAMIETLSADKITAGQLGVGQTIDVGDHVRISGDGWIETYAEPDFSRGGDYARFAGGEVALYKNVPGVGVIRYSYLSRLEAGMVSSWKTGDAPFVIPGYWKTQPTVMVSPAMLQLYNPTYANQGQSIKCYADELKETSAGSMQWCFKPVAQLVLSANSGSLSVNVGSGQLSVDTYMSAEYTTTANCRNITPSIQVMSTRQNTLSQNYYRSAKWRIDYWDAYASVWVLGTVKETKIGTQMSPDVTDSMMLTFPVATANAAVSCNSAWKWRIAVTFSDTDGTVFGGAAYEYQDITVNAASTNSGSISSTSNTPVTQTVVHTLPSYTPPSGWSIIGVTYSCDYAYAISARATGSPSVGSTGRINGIATGEVIAGSSYVGVNSQGNISSYSAYSSGKLTVSAYYPTSLSADLYAAGGMAGYTPGATSAVAFKNGKAIINIRRPVPVSQTPNNRLLISGYVFNLSSAQILAEGSLNYIAVGS